MMNRPLRSIGPVVVAVSAAAWLGPTGCGGDVQMDLARNAGAGGASASGTGSAGSQSGTTSTGAHGGAGNTISHGGAAATSSQGGGTASQGGTGSGGSQGGAGGTAGGGGCAPGKTTCGGACVDLAVDADHCGACGHACGQNAICASGTCQCSAPFSDCDANPANGCEANLSSDLGNCGLCGAQCILEPPCWKGCINGMCVIAACEAWYAECNGDCADGCETDLTNDPMNCGSCGKVCPAGKPCVEGVCQ